MNTIAVTIRAIKQNAAARFVHQGNKIRHDKPSLASRSVLKLGAPQYGMSVFRLDDRPSL